MRFAKAWEFTRSILFADFMALVTGVPLLLLLGILMLLPALLSGDQEYGGLGTTIVIFFGLFVLGTYYVLSTFALISVWIAASFSWAARFVRRLD